MYIIFNESMINKVKVLYKGGSVKCICIFKNETGEVCEVVTSTTECYRYLNSHNVYDDTQFSSVIINCNEIYNIEEGRLQV